MWQAPKNETKTFDPHPTGPYVARICDQWEVEQENPYFGSTNPDGKVDERRTVTNVCIAMLTAESIEIDGQLRPRWVSFWASKSWHEKSNLRKFVAGFDPSFAANDQADPEELIGKKIILVQNLKPAKLCGVESCGMILSAVHGDDLKVVFVDNMPVGSKIC